MNERSECSIHKLVSIVERLRSPDGCPWDKAQTTDSLRPFLLEECHEYLCALEQENNQDIQDELGDLLLQIVLHAQIFKEQGTFTLNDAAESICNKLIRRHPHVFAKQENKEPVDLDLQWEAIKLSEKNSSKYTPSLFDSIETDLPPLQLAKKISEKAKRVGLDWPDAKSVLDTIREEIDELEEALQVGSVDEITHEIGDLLFSTVNLARHLNIDAEISLQQMNLRFISRVQHIESALHAQSKIFSDVTIEQLDRMWGRAKQAEKNEKRA
jgi:MazG family protein